MTHDEMVTLIQVGITETGGVWADFGAGRGNFTRALRECVGPDATLYAIDRDPNALRAHDDAHTITADFTQPLTALPLLNGLLMANALHWVQQQAATLQRLAAYLRPGGHCLIVEYDVHWPRSYIPFPVPYQRFAMLAPAAGFQSVHQIGARPSPSNGVVMYSALAIKS